MTPSVSAPFGSKAGFTLTELMIAAALFTMVMSVSLGVYIAALGQSQEISQQLAFVNKARTAEQKIVTIIQEARAVGAETGQLNIVMTDLTVGALIYEDLDSNAATLADNRLRYDPDVGTTGGEVILCDHVSEIAGEAMFQTLSTSPVSAALAFHVGEATSTNAVAVNYTQGHQGIEVRLSATPRNARGTIY